MSTAEVIVIKPPTFISKLVAIVKPISLSMNSPAIISAFMTIVPTKPKVSPTKASFITRALYPNTESYSGSGKSIAEKMVKETQTATRTLNFAFTLL